jgi:hypothetical protein
MFFYIVVVGVISTAVYILTKLIFDLLLRGFTPFISSRPWVVDLLLEEIKFRKNTPVIYALSCGRSGFFHALEKKYPEAYLVGFETDVFPFLVAKIQNLIRRTKIRVRYSKIHHINFEKADLVYNHLYPDKMVGLGKKMKFECKSGTQVLSTGFNVKGLDLAKTILLPDGKGRWDFLSKNQKMFQKTASKFKKEKKAFFYEI